MSAPRFASVIIDVDSTLAGIEGIDWLAERRGPALAARIAEVTDRAMNGEIPLDAVYGERLALVRPTRAEIDALGTAYCQHLATGAFDAVKRMQSAGITLVIVSGGIRQAIIPLAAALGIDDAEVYAVRIDHDEDGEYRGFDADSLLAKQGGKRTVAQRLSLPRPVLAVGDGITDAEMRPVLDAFALYTEFMRRDAAAAAADVEFATFDAVADYVLP